MAVCRPSAAALPVVLLLLLAGWWVLAPPGSVQHAARHTEAPVRQCAQPDPRFKWPALLRGRGRSSSELTIARPAGGSWLRRWGTPSTRIAAPPPPVALRLDQRTWVDEMAEALRGVKRLRGGGIESLSYVEAMEAIPPVYDALLSLSVVTGFMRRDLAAHAANVRRSVRGIPHGRGATLQGIVGHALETHERHELARKTSSMVGGVLWLNRAATFIAAFIRGLVDGRASREAARVAYESTLQMYHSSLTSAFVSRAVGLCPERGKILEKLQYASEAEARRPLLTLLSLLEPLTAEIRAFMEQMGANFPDRIG